jgi:Ala-tRNA(Pro) deacylase
MSVAYRVQDYIAEKQLPWDPVRHPASNTCLQAAHSAHLPAQGVAKAVLLKDEQGYVVVVVGADREIHPGEVDEALGQRNLRFASERELGRVFDDCLPGAVPPVGQAYGIPTVWDDSLADEPDVYFEGGDHRTLVHMKGGDFEELMRSACRLRQHSL